MHLATLPPVLLLGGLAAQTDELARSVDLELSAQGARPALIRAVLVPGVDLPEAWRRGWPKRVSATAGVTPVQVDLERDADGLVESVAVAFHRSLKNGGQRTEIVFAPARASSGFAHSGALLRYGDTPVLRYVSGYDPNRRDATYKVFHHVYGVDGEPITKGPGGTYTHHRGLFAGFNKTGVGDRSYDFWHCTAGCSVRGISAASGDAGPVTASHRADIDWLDADARPIVHERREVRVWRAADRTVFDFDLTLTTSLERVRLAGDAQHAGFQFRAVQAVHDNAGRTRYLRSEGAHGGDNDVWQDCRWVVCQFAVRDQPYAVMHMDHPDNPDDTVYSTRAYGRFGAFPRGEIGRDRGLTLRYRIVLFPPPAKVDRETLDQLYRDYAEPAEVRVVGSSPR